MLKKIIIFVLMVQIAYSTQLGDKKLINILKNKPYFTVSIDKTDVKIFVTLNGQTVYKGYILEPVITQIPVNAEMTSGENILEVKLLKNQRDDPDSYLDKNTKASVKLQVKQSGNFEDEPLTISEILFINENGTFDEKIDKNVTLHLLNKVKNSTRAGRYNSNDNFTAKEDGDVIISDTTIKILDENRTTEPYKTYVLRQSIYLYTPFPRWKFLDSDDIYTDGNFYNITLDNFYKLKDTPMIKELYALQEKIYNAFKNKDIKSIIDMFDERSEEIDLAFYREKGYTKQDLYESLVEDSNNPDIELLPFEREHLYFYITENSKTIYIKQALAFNYKGGGSSNYPIHWRYQNGKWIITR